jgi:GTPase
VKFNGRKAYLSDTVGFIRNLPHLLVESFHSTLSEFIYADLLLLVVDVSEEREIIQDKLNICLNVLDDVGVKNIPILTVFNKIDREPRYLEKIRDLSLETPHVAVSALTGQNLDLLEAEAARLMGGYVHLKALMSNHEKTFQLLSELKQVCNIHKIEFVGDSVEVDCDAPYNFAERIRKIAHEFQVV